jgi:histone H3/H4
MLMMERMDDDDGQMGAIPAYEESYNETPRGLFLQSGDNDDFSYPLPIPQESGSDDDVERSDAIGAAKTKGPKTEKRKREMKRTRDGLEFPPFPKKVIKKLAATVSGHKITNETLNVLARATDSFFEQAAEDLSAYAQHAKRRTIDDSDVIQLMRR